MFSINEMVEQMMACLLNVASGSCVPGVLQRAYKHSADASAVTIGEEQNANYPQGRGKRSVTVSVSAKHMKMQRRHT